VYQDASIGEIQTLLSQRGMKLAWTIIETLPQLGLIGTLIGLMAMFMSFRTAAAAPEISIISGFSTALGTTILANLFVLILRPLHMQNERTMHEILSTLQTLMAIFILPTQQYAMDRSLGRAPQLGQSYAPVVAPALTSAGEQRISRTLEQLAGTMREFVSFQEKVDSGTIAKETARIAQDVQSALRTFQESVKPDQLALQQRALGKLTESVQGLAEKLASSEKPAAGPSEHNERIEHDLTQLRVLTRDTLVLLEQIANRLSNSSDGAKNLLSLRVDLNHRLFSEGEREPVLAGSGSTEPARAERGPRAVERPAERPPEKVAERNAERPLDVPSERERPARAEISPPKIRLARDRS
jgi:hypothetical protein